MSDSSELVEKRLAWIARAKMARPELIDVSLADVEPGGVGEPNRYGMPVTPGVWEQRGYSNTAEPWHEDRFSRRSGGRVD
jgi:DMSO/TMAO reductase YedYZ molybdopterin-dependent catalytic subunit